MYIKYLHSILLTNSCVLLKLLFTKNNWDYIRRNIPRVNNYIVICFLLKSFKSFLRYHRWNVAISWLWCIITSTILGPSRLSRTLLTSIWLVDVHILAASLDGSCMTNKEMNGEENAAGEKRGLTLTLLYFRFCVFIVLFVVCSQYCLEL